MKSKEVSSIISYISYATEWWDFFLVMDNKGNYGTGSGVVNSLGDIIFGMSFY